MTQTTTADANSGREGCSEPVQMQLALRDSEAVSWTTSIPGQTKHHVKLNSDADMDDVIQMHKTAKEFDRTVSLRDECPSGGTIWELEKQ